MKVPGFLLRALRNRFIPIAGGRAPDFVIGPPETPYLRRWWIIPRNPIFNIYLHHFLRSDEDRAHHDHPWANVSILLSGSYLEHVTRRDGSHGLARRHEGDIAARGPRAAHRVELVSIVRCPAPGAPTTDIVMPVMTLFITGPRVRQWGFLCPQGWRHHTEFTDPGTGGATVGKGCGE